MREDCHKIITKQGCPEGTGWAKLTRAYNLPARFILHTVGPIIPNPNKVSIKQKNELSSCYSSCLDLIKYHDNIKSVAFCSISTGVFGFPIEEAATIALDAVKRWLLKNPNIIKIVVFLMCLAIEIMKYIENY